MFLFKENESIVRMQTAIYLILVPTLSWWFFGEKSITGIALLFSIGLIAESIWLYKQGKIPGYIVILSTLYIWLALILFTHIYLQHCTKMPRELEIFMFILNIIIMDIAGYYGGRFFGGVKLAPEVSPNKTVSGVISGLVAIAIYSVIICYLQQDFSSLFMIIIMRMYIGLISLNGDLLISKVKRVFNIKDTSSFLPGHGGLWDRLDSILHTIILFPFAFLTIHFFSTSLYHLHAPTDFISYSIAIVPLGIYLLYCLFYLSKTVNITLMILSIILLHKSFNPDLILNNITLL